MMSKVLCALLWNLPSLPFSPSSLWSANFETKQAQNLWHHKYFDPCSCIHWAFMADLQKAAHFFTTNQYNKITLLNTCAVWQSRMCPSCSLILCRQSLPSHVGCLPSGQWIPQSMPMHIHVLCDVWQPKVSFPTLKIFARSMGKIMQVLQELFQEWNEYLVEEKKWTPDCTIYNY